ncbi:MAG: hypothetical protein NTW19_11555 [Planctomycetota bacterium]|nr:hypothetical protein [Planctomycetota bacterium]
MRLQHLPAPVADRLRQYARRKAVLRALRLTFIAFLSYVLLVLVMTHVDRFAFLDSGQRQGHFWLVHGLLALLVLVELVWLARQRSTARELAYELESRLGPKAAERLVTLENVRSRGEGRATPAGAVEAELAAALEASTIEYSRDLPAARLARDPLARRLGIASAVVALGCAALFAAPLYQFPLMLQRFYQPSRDLPRPSFIALEVTPNQAILGRGAEAVIQARVVDRTPAPLRWLMDLLHAAPRGCVISIEPLREHAATAPASAPATQAAPSPTVAPTATTTANMVRVQRDIYLFTRGNLQESFAFDVTCGNAQSARQAVRVATQPRIVALRLTATPPAYSNLPVQRLDSLARPMRFLPGTQIELAFTTDQPVKRRLLHVERAPKPIDPAWDEATLTGTHRFVLKEPVALEFEVVNSLGFANVDRSPLRIGLQDDQPPTIRLDLPPQEIETVAASLVSFQGQVEDDLGLAEASLKFVLNPDPKREPTPREIVLPIETPGQRKLELAAALDLEKTGAVPGDTLQVEVRARDTRGSDSLSRPVLIHVVPFTRGADEQRRIAALRVVAGALDAMLAAGKAADAESGYAAVDNDAYAALVKTAASAGVTLAEAASARSIIDLLESEQYLTRDPRDQRDVREIHAVFARIAGPMGLSAEGRAALVKAQGPRLAAAIRALANYRDARNMLWRFLGMREESVRLRGVLADLQEKESPPAEEIDRLNRRTSLVLAALQDLGASFLELSRSTPGINAKAATDLVGEINETGFFITRGSMARRKSSAAQIAQKLGDALALLRPTLPTLLERDLAARREVESLYATALGTVASGPADAAKPDPAALGQWLDAASAWLAADRRLMEREPFAPITPRLTGFALAESLARVRGAASAQQAALEAQRRAVAAAILRTDVPWSAAADRERAVHDRLVLAWLTETTRRWPNLSDVERQLEIALIAGEFAAARATSPAAIAAALDPVLRLPLDSAASQPAAAAAGREMAAATADAREAAKEIAAIASTRPEFAALKQAGSPELAQACVAAVAEASASFTALEKAIANDASAADLARQLRATLRAFDNQAQTLDLAADTLSMSLLVLPGSPDVPASRDALLLGLRDLHGRFRQRTSTAFDALRAATAADASAQQLGEVKSQSGRLKLLQEALAAGTPKLFGAASATQPGGAGAGGRTAATLARSAALARATLESTGKPEAGRLAATLTQLPGAAASLLASRGPAVVAARQGIVDALAAVEDKSPDPVRAGASLSRARAAMDEFRGLAEQIGAANLPPAITAPLAVAATELQRLPAVPADGDATALGKLRFALGEARRKFDALVGAVRALGAQSSEEGLEYQGGPVRAWAERNGYEAQAVRQRLLALSRFAQGQALAGLLPAAGATTPTSPADSVGEAYAWAALLYRLQRSELAGAGLAQTTQRPAGKVTDPLLEFLRGELQKAKQQQKLLIEYSEPTKAYLDMVGDYLRY